MKKLLPWVFSFFSMIFLGFLSPLAADPMGTAFTYQGRLTDGGGPANGTYDFQFKLYDSLVGGSQVGSTFSNPAVPVSNGLFTVVLDFGEGIFTGPARYLEIAIRPGGSGSGYTTLEQRQTLSPVPYALTAASGPPGKTINVYGSNDQFLGFLTSGHSGAYIFLPNQNCILAVDYDGEASTALIYFKSNDCTGQPYMTYWSPGVWNSSKNKLYCVTGAPRETGMISELRADGVCQPTVGNPKYPAREITLPFSIPLSVPLRFVYE